MTRTRIKKVKNIEEQHAEPPASVRRSEQTIKSYLLTNASVAADCFSGDCCVSRKDGRCPNNLTCRSVLLANEYSENERTEVIMKVYIALNVMLLLF